MKLRTHTIQAFPHLLRRIVRESSGGEPKVVEAIEVKQIELLRHRNVVENEMTDIHTMREAQRAYSAAFAAGCTPPARSCVRFAAP